MLYSLHRLDCGYTNQNTMSGRYSTSGNADLIVVVKPTNATFVNCPPNRPLTVEVPIIPIGELADKNRDKWCIETHFDESDVNKSCGACEEEVISACTVQDQHGRNTNTRHARYNYLNLGDSVEENIVSQRASQLWSSRPCMETRDDECDAIENRETCEEEEITTCTVKDQHGRNTNTKYHQYNYTNIPGLSRRGPVEDFIMPQQASRYWSSREVRLILSSIYVFLEIMIILYVHNHLWNR